jgi:putative transcriptional regulator
VFAGYAGWAPGQLEAETDREDWLVLAGDRTVVFGDPEDVWDRLIEGPGTVVVQDGPADQLPSSEPSG